MTLHPMDLKDRRFLVTGASSGIGREIAIYLSQLNAFVIGIGRNKERLEETLNMMEGAGHRCMAVDLRDSLQVDALMQECSPLNGFVHSAGIQSLAPVNSETVDHCQEVLATNLVAALVLSKSFLKRGVYAGSTGSIVFISSVMARVGAAGRSLYSMSKGGLEAMSRSLAIELAPKGIRVNCVSPGFVQTRMLDETRRIWTHEQAAQVEALHPLGFGTPLDIAASAAFLLSSASRWITGTVLTVDGGYTAQ